MNRPKYFIANVAVILAVALTGLLFVMAFDQGGTRWLRFALYFCAFVALMSPFLFSSSSSSSCSLLFSRLRKLS